MLPALGIIPTAVASSSQAQSVVEDFQGALLDVLKRADALGFDGRRTQLASAINRTFDKQYMVRAVLGPYWADMNAPDQGRVRDAMFGFATSMLARNFDDYSGQHFETQFARELQSGSMRVRSHFHLGESVPVNTDFVLHEVGGQWRIIDFWFSGVSGTRIHRGEFQSILAKGGTEALLAELHDKIEQLSIE